MAQRLSVLVPVCNGARFLPHFFAALGRQSLQPEEILVADSESTDGSAQICKQYGARVLPVKRAAFDHGGTRSMLAAEAAGDILVYFTQDALLAKEDSLQRLVDALTRSENIACAYGRQLPAADALLSAALLRTFNYPATSEIRQYADRSRLGLKTAFISNSYAAYKKEILCTVGAFQNGLIFGEDTCTLGKLLAAGYRVAYCAEAAVFHSHNYRMIEEFRRSFDIGVLHSSEKWLLDTYGQATSVGGNYVLFSLRYILKNRRYLQLCDWFCRNGVKCIGYQLGRKYAGLPKTVAAHCSMHRHWWCKKETSEQ